MKRRVFYSFHYKPDNWRAAQVRNIGVIEGNRPAADNDWEAVTKGGHKAIEKWIADQMYGRSCTVVLVGTYTAGRKWIKHEISKSWSDGMGLVGIYIHGLENANELVSTKGRTPSMSLTTANLGRSYLLSCGAIIPGGAAAESDTIGSENIFPTSLKKRFRYGTSISKEHLRE